MCGFAGIASFGRPLQGGAADTAVAMAETLSHRGPDAAGVWSDPRVALAHRRLAILDVSDSGAQPMVSDSGRYVVAFNGEIYNYRDLGARLRNEGWRSRGGSDTEVLLAAVESWGLDRFLHYADGMFAFALYDRNQERLMLVRDRFGEKPLAYCVHGSEIYFASELRAFTRVRGLALSLDRAATADYFRYGYVPGRATIYEGISRLAPASLLEVDLKGTANTKPQERGYWEVPRPACSPTGVGDRSDQLAELLSTSVRNRLVSDRPVGGFLSGGIDSSLTSAVAAQHMSGALKTFTMGWDDAEYDESGQAAEVANVLGADHHAVRLSRADAVSATSRLGSVMDEPFADSSQLAVLLVASEAKKHVVVALSGDGGDELFAGYNRHKWLLPTRVIQKRVPRWVRQAGASLTHQAAPLIERIVMPLPVGQRPRLVADKLHKLARVMAAPTLVESYQSLIANDVSLGRPRQLSPRLQTALTTDGPDGVLWAVRAADLAGYLPDDVLTKVDRATMSLSLESRTPFLNTALLELALGMGADQLLGRSGGKRPLRVLLKRLLPSVRFDQPKTGFGIPVASLLRNELRSTLSDAVCSQLARHPPVVAPWQSRFAKLVRGDDSPAPSLWSLLMFELWADEAPHAVSWR